MRRISDVFQFTASRKCWWIGGLWSGCDGHLLAAGSLELFACSLTCQEPFIRHLTSVDFVFDHVANACLWLQPLITNNLLDLFDYNIILKFLISPFLGESFELQFFRPVSSCHKPPHWKASGRTDEFTIDMPRLNLILALYDWGITAYRLGLSFCLLCRRSPWWSPCIIGRGSWRRHGWTHRVCPSCWTGRILIASGFSYISLPDDTDLIHWSTEHFLMNLAWQSLLSLLLRFKNSHPAVYNSLHSVKIGLNLMHGLIKKRLWRSSLPTSFWCPSRSCTIATRMLRSWRI